MNLRWSLKELYPSFDSKEFKRDFTKSDELIEELVIWSERNLDNQKEAIRKCEEFISMLSNLYEYETLLGSFARLTLSVEAKNNDAVKVIERLEKRRTKLKKPYVKFQKWLGSLANLDSIISASPLLKEHNFILHELTENSKFLLKEEEEVLIEKMSITGSKAWNKLHQLLTSTLLVNINLDGRKKSLPLPVVRNMAHDNDPHVRKTTYKAELEAYRKIEDSSAAALNGIKGESITISSMRGYKSPLEETLINSRMDRESLEIMLTAIKESLPAFQNYYHKKAELLGYKNGLPFYDLFAPMGKTNKKFTFEETREFIVKKFKSFSTKLADYADQAFEKKWIDAEPREGKEGGAFCSNIHPIGESRILTNFTGNLSDVITLAHELGHGYHGSCLVLESNLNSNYPMPLAETASIFCETIVNNALLKEASEEGTLNILENSIANDGQVIVDIYSRYLFETKVFAERNKSSMNVDDFKNLMIDAQKEAYGNGLDPDYLHPYMWVNKPHYYFPKRNFYNYPYAFGLLFAKGLYAEYLKRGDEFVTEYDQLLAVTGKKKIADVTKTMNIDIHSIDFWRDSLKLIEEDIEKFLSFSS